MAKKSSTRSGRSKTQPDTTAPDSVAVDAAAGELGGDTVVLGDDTLGEDAVAAGPAADDRVTIEPGDTTAADADTQDPAQTEILDAEPVAEDAAADSETTHVPAPAPAPVVEQRGPGMGALLIGGVVAAALG